MKTLREILEDVSFAVDEAIPEALTLDDQADVHKLKADLLAWAKAYGEQVRHHIRDLAIGLDGATYVTDRMRDEKLPEPK